MSLWLRIKFVYSCALFYKITDLLFIQISLNTLRNYFDAIYDVTVIYEGTGSQAHRRASPSLFGTLVNFLLSFLKLVVFV